MLTSPFVVWRVKAVTRSSFNWVHNTRIDFEYQTSEGEGIEWIKDIPTRTFKALHKHFRECHLSNLLKRPRADCYYRPRKSKFEPESRWSRDPRAHRRIHLRDRDDWASYAPGVIHLLFPKRTIWLLAVRNHAWAGMLSMHCQIFSLVPLAGSGVDEGLSVMEAVYILDIRTTIRWVQAKVCICDSKLFLAIVNHPHLGGRIVAVKATQMRWGKDVLYGKGNRFTFGRGCHFSRPLLGHQDILLRFRWDGVRRLLLSGEESPMSRTRISKRAGEDWEDAWQRLNLQLIWGRFWGTEQGRHGFLSLSGAMLLGSLASSWSNVIS